MDTLRAKLQRLRRRLARLLRSLAGRVDPGYALPAQYTTGHVMRYHELLIDVGLADVYDESAAETRGAGGGKSAVNGSAPPPDARHDPKRKEKAREAMRAAGRQVRQGNGITPEQARRIRQAFVGELERLNLIVLDIDEDEAPDVPVDVTIQALMHFVPVYAAVAGALTGTESAMMPEGSPA